MAAICTGTFSGGGGQFLVNTNITGTPNLRASHTFCVRVKHTSTATNYDSIIAGFCNSGQTSGSWFGRNNGQGSTLLNTYRGAGSTAATRGPCYGDTTTWYHLTFVYNASTQFIRFYIDGTYIGQQSSATTTSSSSTTNGLYLCQHPGKYADIGLWNRALSDSEVADQAAYRECQVTSGLLAFYRLDSNGNDSSGAGENLTTQGSGTAVTYSTADNPPQPESPAIALTGDATNASTLAGNLTINKALAGGLTSGSTLAGSLTINKALSGGLTSGNTLAGAAALSLALTGAVTSANTLTGTAALGLALTGAATSANTLAAWIRPRWGRRLASANALTGTVSIAQASWTVMAWVRPISTPDGGEAVLTIGSSSGTEQVFLGIRGTTGNAAAFDIGAFDSSFSYAFYGSANDGNWHHVAVTSDGSSILAYVDGVQVAASAGALAATFTSLGVYSSSGASVDIAHVKAWTATLSPAQISQEATYYTPSTANAQLYAWWPLTWSSVGSDASGNGHSLTDASTTEALTEAPTSDLTLLAGTATSASTLTGTLSQAQPLTSALTSANTLAGNLSVSVALTGGSTNASTLAGTLSQAQPLTGGLASANTLAGSLAIAVPLSGTLGNANTLSTPQLDVHHPLTGGLTSANTFGGLLGVDGLLSGQLQNANTFSGELAVFKPVDGALTSANTLGGILSQLQPLGGALSNANTLAGSIQVILQCSGQLQSASTLSGALSVALALAGSATSANTLTGSLSLSQALSGGTTNANTLAGALSVQNLMTGAMTSGNTLAGSLSVNVFRALTGVVSSANSLSGSLSVVQPAAARGNVVTNGQCRAEIGPATIIGPSRGRAWPPRPR